MKKEIGFDCQKTIHSHGHYVSLYYFQLWPPLDSTLVHWLSSNSPDSQVIYISMDTTGEVTDEIVKSFIECSMKYIIIYMIITSIYL